MKSSVKIKKYAFVIDIAPILFGIVIGILLKSLFMGFVIFLLLDLLEFYYLALKYNLMVGYLGGGWYGMRLRIARFKKKSEKIGWLIFYTLLYFFMFILAWFVFR